MIYIMTALTFSLLRSCVSTAMCVATIWCLASQVARPQLPADLDLDGAGTLYYVAFPDTAGNRIDPRFPNNRVASETSLWLFSATTASVKITQNAVTDVVSLEPGKFKIYQFRSNPTVAAINTVGKGSVRVESDVPIVMYCYAAAYQGAETWTPLPVNTWGTRYTAACVPGERLQSISVSDEVKVKRSPLSAPAEVLVVAGFDSTTVTITPPAGMRFLGNPPATVKLNEGETFQVQSIVDTASGVRGDDIAGTVISADKPVGVISGNTRARVNAEDTPLVGNAYMNPMIEWLTPIEQHGRKFVWLPTYDSRRMGSGAVAERRREYLHVYNTSKAGAMKGYMLNASTAQTHFVISGRDTCSEMAFGTAAGVYVETEGPAMAMMHSMAIIRQTSSTPTGYGVPAQEFEGWAPYMVSLVPREQWGNFAPYYAPTNPGAMQSFISVVTDTVTAKQLVRENGSTFLLNRKIPGTDLIWGTMNVSPGEDHWVHAKNGGTFTGMVFGLFRGEEKYRPGGARRRDAGDTRTIASAAATAHPAEFEEYNALSYGYPLVARRRFLSGPDTLKIDTVLDCERMTLTIRSINLNPVGLRSVTLDPTSLVNARLVPIDPARLSDLVGMTNVVLHVEAVDPSKDARAVILIKDRSGKSWQVPFHWIAERLDVTPALRNNFGDPPPYVSTIQTVTLTNPTTQPLTVKGVELASGTQGFSVVSTTPAVPTVLAPGARMTVRAAFNRKSFLRRSVDTLTFWTSCAVVKQALVSGPRAPVLDGKGVDVGLLVKGVDAPKSLLFTVRNVGDEDVRLVGARTEAAPSADTGAVIVWDDPAFSIDPSVLAALRNRLLKPGETIEIPVVFNPSQAADGPHDAHVLIYTDSEPDSAVWRATVLAASDVRAAQLAGYRVNVQRVDGGAVQVLYALPMAGHLRLEAFNASGERVALLVDEPIAAGEHRTIWRTSGLPSGMYYCRMSVGPFVNFTACALVR